MKNPPTSSRSFRCAVYTRKSSEEGLDQAFNSLDAQREACEAYIRSQAGEGWTLVRAAYDDGGISGGTMERPGLKRLLADIATGKVDTVVVYKVDRLTRALSDFAKMVELFDAHGVSFVSVTQAFNTTTSMGRLTLNVLLSFAQFEREVTSERIRDKLAASRAKGMWMGGLPPLGYDRPTDPQSRVLLVNEVEAQAVRAIFARYLEVRSLSDLCAELARTGVRSKLRTFRSGSVSGGGMISRGALFHLLTNRVYVGEITHKHERHPGLHAGIVDQHVFDAVEQALAEKAPPKRQRRIVVAPARLKGLLFDSAGAVLTPTHSRSRDQSRVYRYYRPIIDPRAPVEEFSKTQTPADLIENFVIDQLQAMRAIGSGADPWAAATAVLRRVELHENAVHLVIATSDAAKLEAALVEGATASPDAVGLRVVIPTRLKRRGGRTELCKPAGRAPPKVRHDRTLIKGLSGSHQLLRRLSCSPWTGSAGLRLARAGSGFYERALTQVGYLAPDIQQAILQGRQPAGLSMEVLIHREIPLAWEDQRRMLGFEPA